MFYFIDFWLWRYKMTALYTKLDNFFKNPSSITNKYKNIE